MLEVNFRERALCEVPRPPYRRLRQGELRRIPKGEVRRIPLPRTPVNKGERMSRWANTGRDEGSVLIMGINSERRQAGGRM